MKSVPGPLTILIVEDTPSDSYLIEEMLLSSTLGIEEIYTAERLADALVILKEHPVSLVLLDLSLPDSAGIDSMVQLKEIGQKTPIIILTGYNDSEMAFEALKHGAQDYLVKGEFNAGFLVKSIQYSIERIRLQNEISLKKKQIIQAVLTAQENERRGIGLELHDNINQILSAIQLNLGFALEHSSKAKELIVKSMGNTSLAIEEIRKLSKALILPGNLKELGLVASIDLLINDLHPVTDINLTLDVSDLQEALLSEEQKINLYRIVQEQINNILKHAHCSKVNIRLDTTEQQVRLIVSDNGVGFDTRAARKGIGLTNIISRTELFNGKVNINSSPGNGCTLEVVLQTKIQLPQEAA
ncbi:MAG TPA: response regulator [Chitinophagaceae bacterium]|nr:response regulator [Chitinophagaceae bacterium]